MKAAMENQIHDEPSSRFDSVGKRSLPKLSYREALNSFFISRSGAVHLVSSCNVFVFQDLVDDAIPTARKASYVHLALRGLHYTEKLDRWYALNELLIHGAIVKLYATKEQANNVILMAKSEDVRK